MKKANVACLIAAYASLQAHYNNLTVNFQTTFVSSVIQAIQPAVHRRKPTVNHLSLIIHNSSPFLPSVCTRKIIIIVNNTVVLRKYLYCRRFSLKFHKNCLGEK